MGRDDVKKQYQQSINAKEGVTYNAVSRPAHYADKEIEVIDYIYDTLTHEGYEGYCIGNVIKYISRYRKKGGAEDLRKAKTYLVWAIDEAMMREGGKE